AADAGAADADRLADQLQLLLAGAQVSVQMTGRPDGCRRAAEVCRVLLRDATV
ncbi:MAG: TetR family transcriptional regulator, partial [bacterium]|nr:TetR family transcriptional regulator [bacterium]